MLLNPDMDSPLANDVPCIVSLSMPNSGDRLYGPFKNLIEAMNWVDKVRVSFPWMGFLIQPLRRTDRDRYSSEHWFGYEEGNPEMFIEDLMDIQKWNDYQAAKA